MIFLSPHERERQIAALVIQACALVASGKSARSVRILANDGPTKTDLRRYRDLARARHVRLRVDRGGVIVLQPDVRDEADLLFTGSATIPTTSISAS